MRILQTFAFIGLACIAAAQTPEKMDLAAKPKAGAIQKFKIEAKVADQVEIKGVVEAKAAKVEKETATEVEWKCLELKQIVNGSDMGDEAPPALTFKPDKHGLPSELSVDEGRAVYVALAISTYRPGQLVAVGEEFKIDWKGKSDGGTMSGVGMLKEVKDVAGAKVAVVRLKVQMTPAGQSNPADLEILSEYNMADGSLMRSTMKGTITEGDFSCTIVATK